MKRAIVIPCALAATLLALPAVADSPPPPDGVWLGAGQGGLLISSGNTASTSFNAKLDLARSNGPWKNILFFGGLYGKSNGITSGERMEGRYQLNRMINERMFWFGSLSAVRDLFSGFAYQATASAGLGDKFIDNADTKFSGTLGVGYQRLETQQLIKDASGAVVQRINGGSQGGVVATGSLSYEHKLTASTKLSDKLFVTVGSADSTATNDVALAVSINDRLALSVGYGVRYNTKPAAGVKKLDQVETVNVVYMIK